MSPLFAEPSYAYLPKEISREIFEQLELGDLIACQMSCKVWNQNINENSDAFFSSFAERVSFFFRRNGERYFCEKGKVKERFIVDYTDVLKHVRIKNIDEPKGLKKIIWLNDLGNKNLKIFYKTACDALMIKNKHRQKKWKMLIPLFKLGCIYEELDYRLFLLVRRTFGDKLEMCEKAYADLFQFHKFESLEKDAELWGKAAFYAWRKKNEAAKQTFLENGGESAEKTFEPMARRHRQLLQIVRLGMLLVYGNRLCSSARC